MKMWQKIAVGTATVGIVGGGVAYASIPDGSGVIHGCIKANGMARVIDSDATSCPTGETSLNWNQTGAQGAQGAQGEQGPAGDPASVPTDTVYGVYQRDVRHIIPAGTEPADLDGGHWSDHCGQGEILLSAYAWVQVQSHAPGTVDAGAVYNSDNGSGAGPNGVQSITWNRTGDEGEARIVLVCAHES